MNVVGMPLTEATDALWDNGFRGGNKNILTGVPTTDSSLANIVFAQQPAAGSVVPVYVPVVLRYHAHSAPVPSVVGKAEAEAMTILSKAGYAVEVAPIYSIESQKNGVVKKQVPAAGSPLSAKEIVTIQVIRYELAPLPNIAGLPAVKAQETIENAGFINAPTYSGQSTTDSKLFGLVAKQMTPPAAAVPKGTIVYYAVYGEMATIPNIIKSPYTAAITKLATQKLGHKPKYYFTSLKEADGIVLGVKPEVGTKVPTSTAPLVVVGKYTSNPVVLRFTKDKKTGALVMGITGGTKPYKILYKHDQPGAEIKGVPVTIADKPSEILWFRLESKMDVVATITVTDAADISAERKVPIVKNP
jgi:beta-lactam-binding protein with PASTA domain